MAVHPDGMAGTFGAVRMLCYQANQNAQCRS